MKVLILHGYSDSNKGDLAIVVGMVKGIRAARPGCELVLQSVYSESDPDFAFHHRFVRKMGLSVQQMAVPSPYTDTASLSAFRNLTALMNLVGSTAGEWLNRMLPPTGALFPRQAAALRSMRESDVVLLKGGQYVYNDQGGVRGFLYLWRILHPVHLAKRLGKDVVLLGQSVGPLVDDRGKQMTRRALAGCSRLVVRERKSANLLEELGLGAQVQIAPDFAFLIDPVRPHEFDALAKKIEAGRWLGVTVVNWSFPESRDPTELRERYLAAVVEIAGRTHRTLGLGIALFPQVTVQHHGESDLDLLKRLAAKLAENGIPHLLVTEDLAPEGLSYLYGRCEVLLGTRLHSCILAACAGTPVVAIRYQGFKTEGIMAELGLENRVFDISGVDVDRATAEIAISVASRETISRQILQRVQTFRESLMAVLGKVLP